ncbi:DUF4143 domain-containing protein [Nocardia sp. NPDC050799]|uniref:DUF4143 domain-containing protein n=1 Tax=Nocardia sp. NPDC050799 TaxID=3154842 RepID=UPI00340D45B1
MIIIERHGEMLKLPALLAGRVGNLLVPGTLAGQSGLSRTTVVRYIELLHSVFLIKSIPAWSPGPTFRAIGTPNLAFVDSGIAGTSSDRTPRIWTTPAVPPVRCWKTSWQWNSRDN